jgi:hypothetical protein
VPPLPDEDFFAHCRGGAPAAVYRDRRLALAVVRALTNDVRTRREAVRVAAQNDVVLLAGTVGSWQTRDTAAELARCTAGAFDLCNSLRVDPDAVDRRRADPFTELIASVPEPRTPIKFRRCRFRAARFGGALLVGLLLLWLILLVAMAAGLPVLPLLVAGLAATVAAAAFRYADHRAAKL